jgi:hypothetical protein
LDVVCGPTFISLQFFAQRLCTGILSLVQISRIRLFGGYFLGTGLISGEFFLLERCTEIHRYNSGWNEFFDPINCERRESISRDLEVVTYGAKIFDAMYRDGTCTSTTNADGTATRNACPDAYGKLLGQWIYASCLSMA